MKVLKYIVLIILLLSIGVWFGIKDALEPVSRAEVLNPIYTIGDLSYQKALEQNKNIIKFGKMFWGIYPGGLAFNSPEEALEFVTDNQDVLNSFSSGWKLYKLSGDMMLDTYQRDGQKYLSNSLLVMGTVSKQ